MTKPSHNNITLAEYKDTCALLRRAVNGRLHPSDAGLVATFETCGRVMRAIDLLESLTGQMPAKEESVTDDTTEDTA